MKKVLACFILSGSLSCNTNSPFSKSAAIRDSAFTGTVTVEKVKKLNRYRLSMRNSVNGKTDRIYTPYEIFDMETGDVNGDGKTDICLGIIKPTPFDPVLKKRLFIFQLDGDYIRPLWLSSRLVHPMEEFIIKTDSTGRSIIRTMERESTTSYCISEYRWQSFGMVRIRENKSGLSYGDAVTLLKK